MGLFDKLVNTGIGMVAGKENIKKAQPIVQAGKQVVKEIQQRNAPVIGGSDAPTPEMIDRLKNGATVQKTLPVGPLGASQMVETKVPGNASYAAQLEKSMANQPKYGESQLGKAQVDHGSILEKFNTFVKTNSQLKKLMPSDDDVATEYLKLHQPEQYKTVRSLLDSTPPNPFEVLKNNGEMKTLKDQGMFQYTQVPLEEKMKITERIMAEKVKKLDYESFLHGVDEHFTQSLKDMYGDKTVKEMEASGLRKEMLKQAIGGYLSGKTMGLSDVLEKHLDGESIPLPVLYKDNANLATAVGVVRAATTLMGGFSTYGAISEQVGAQLKNVGGKFGSFMAKHPTFTSYIIRNAAENSVEAGVRSSTGQEYGVNDFLTGLAMGVAFQGVSDATQLLFKSPLKVTQAIEKSVKEAELAKGDALSPQEFQQTVLNTSIGHGMIVDNLIGESRFANLKGKNKGRPGIDYPAPLPKVEKFDDVSAQVKREPIPEITSPMTKQELLDAADAGFEVPKEVQKKMSVADDLVEHVAKYEKKISEAKTVKEKSALEDVMRKALDSSYLSKFGDEGKQLSDKLHKADKQKDLWAGAASDKLAPKLKALDETQISEFKKLAEGHLATSDASKEAVEAFHVWDEIRTDIAKKAEDFGLVIQTPDGEKVPFTARENYLPKYLKEEELDKLLKSPKKQAELAKRMVESGQFKTVEQADRLIAKYTAMKSSGKYGNLERSRIEGLPDEMYKQDPRETLADYVQGAYKRLADAEQFGGQNEQLDEIMGAYRAKGGDVAQMRDVFEAMAGLKQYGKSATEISNAVRTFQATTKLGLSAATNLGDVIKPFVATDLGSTVKAVMQQFTKEGKSFKRKLNISNALDNLAKDIGETNFSEKVMKYTGVKATEEGLRTVQALAGKNYAQKLFKNLQKSPEGFFSKFNRRRLEAMGVDVEKALKQGGLNENDLLDVGWNAMKDMQPLGRQEVPFYWQSPSGKAATQFKSFAYKQGKFIYKHVLTELAKGNPMPAAKLAFAGLLVGEEVGDLKAGIRFRKRTGTGLNETIGKAIEKGDPAVMGEYFDFQQNWERISDSYMTIGGVGIIGDLVANLKDYDTANNIMRWMAGPTASDIFGAIGNVTQDVQSIQKGDELLGPGELDKGKGKFQSKTLKQLTGLVPIAGQPARNLLFPTKNTYSARQMPYADDIQGLIDQATEKPSQAGGDGMSAKIKAKFSQQQNAPAMNRPTNDSKDMSAKIRAKFAK